MNLFLLAIYILCFNWQASKSTDFKDFFTFLNYSIFRFFFVGFKYVKACHLFQI